MAKAVVAGNKTSKRIGYARIRPCDVCKRRKGRCVRDGPGPCEYCAKSGVECTQTSSLTSSGPNPLLPLAKLDGPPIKDDLEKSTVPLDYDYGCWIGPSCSEDPQLLSSYDRNENVLVRFVAQGVQFSSETDMFEVYRESCHCEPDVQKLRQSKWDKLEAIVEPFRERLLALYFQFVDWTYPAVDKQRFYRAYYFGEPKLNRGLIAGILALSCMYWKYSPELVVKPVPPNLATKLWVICAQEIDHDLTCGGPSLDTIQALFIYLQKRRPGDNTAEQVHARIQTGKLVSIAYTLGLHRDCSDWNISDHEKLTRKRLRALAFYCDRWSAAMIGHPTMFVLSTLDVGFDSVFLQEQPFVEVVKLTELLDEVLKHYPPSHAEAAKHLKALAQWRENVRSLDWYDTNAGHNFNNSVLNVADMTVEALVRRTLPQRRGSRDLVVRIITFTSEITHMHRHAFWLSPVCQQLSTLAHFVLLFHVQLSPAQRLESQALIQQWFQSLRSLASVWSEGAGLAFLKMDAVFHNGIPSFSYRSENSVDSESEPEHEEEEKSDDLMPLEPLGIELLEPLEENAILEMWDPLGEQENLHDILAQYLNEELT